MVGVAPVIPYSRCNNCRKSTLPNTKRFVIWILYTLIKLLTFLGNSSIWCATSGFSDWRLWVTLQEARYAPKGLRDDLCTNFLYMVMFVKDLVWAKFYGCVLEREWLPLRIDCLWAVRWLTLDEGLHQPSSQGHWWMLSTKFPRRTGNSKRKAIKCKCSGDE